MKMKIVLLSIVLSSFTNIQCFFDIQEITSETMNKLPTNFSNAIKDFAKGLPTDALIILSGNSTNISYNQWQELITILFQNNIQVVHLDLKTEKNKEKYMQYMKQALEIPVERNSLILCEPDECETIMKELTEQDLIHRSILYMFYWHFGDITEQFISQIKEAMRVAVITNPRKSVFRVYYNQATPNVLNHMSLVNWWSGKLYKLPLLPSADKIYKDFKGRVLNVPVLHAPPWHFVKYKNDSSINVTGGRDHKLLHLLAHRLNFKFEYFDPPDRTQGSHISKNGTFKGTLGLIWKRQADIFLGDVTITWERRQAVEFSFLTLADSGAFLTHAPEKLNEALALIRPFRWEVWPLVLITLMLSGPALWMVIVVPSLWQRRKSRKIPSLKNCCWFTTALFLRQSSTKEPSKTHKARLVAVLFSLGATYVIGDMYSANLTSLLARPAREQPIGSLFALEEAMMERGYQLVIEGHSSSLSLLQNGTGVYGRIARLMMKQKVQKVNSVEMGVRLVMTQKKIAVLGGRETLYYDTERFGSYNFHMSEKLYTRYAAIAFQVGCPYLETFNNVLMTLFEAGIVSKITTDEYKNLPDHSRKSNPVTESDRVEGTGDIAQAQQPEITKGLDPVSFRMLRGAFLLLGAGHLLSIIILLIEIQVARRAKRTVELSKCKNKKKIIIVLKIRRILKRFYRKTSRFIVNTMDRTLGANN